jgi:UDP-N-acetylmuramyl-tripeptide synthetase
MKEYTLKDYILQIDKNDFLINKTSNEFSRSKVVKFLTYNSKDVIEDTLFVCKGLGFKEQYLDMAINKGAIAYISETDYNKNIPCILVTNIQKVLSLVSNLYYSYPWKDLTLIGFTGTKGKSTTSYYMKYILDEFLTSQGKLQAGIISSINTFDGVIDEESHITTPESLDLQMHFHNALESNLEYVVAEASSQALKYGRLYDVVFNVGVFLNISEDHISPIEHVDFDDYFEAKLSFFAQCQTACINVDSDHFDRILAASKSSPKVLTFGTKQPADIYGYNIRKDGFDTVFHVKTDRFDKEFRLTMPGLFNVENALAAIAVSYSLNIPVEFIYEGLKKARSSGRMEVFMSKNQEKIVIVDYAHNKLSFEKLYESAQNEYAGREIVTVFGCPGGKAFLRRHDLGLLAGIHSNKIYLTAEDPGMEDANAISEEIAQYVKLNNNNYEIIDDRETAIRKSIISSSQNAVILITGKGRETRQKIGKEYIPCISDVDCVIDCLSEYDITSGEAAITM